jgi:hypothetical protein
VLFELDERIQPAGLPRNAFAASSAFIGIDARDTIVRPDHFYSGTIS